MEPLARNSDWESEQAARHSYYSHLTNRSTGGDVRGLIVAASNSQLGLQHPFITTTHHPNFQPLPQVPNPRTVAILSSDLSYTTLDVDHDYLLSVYTSLPRAVHPDFARAQALSVNLSGDTSAIYYLLLSTFLSGSIGFEHHIIPRSRTRPSLMLMLSST